MTPGIWLECMGRGRLTMIRYEDGILSEAWRGETEVPNIRRRGVQRDKVARRVTSREADGCSDVSRNNATSELSNQKENTKTKNLLLN